MTSICSSWLAATHQTNCSHPNLYLESWWTSVLSLFQSFSFSSVVESALQIQRDGIQAPYLQPRELTSFIQTRWPRALRSHAADDRGSRSWCCRLRGRLTYRLDQSFHLRSYHGLGSQTCASIVCPFRWNPQWSYNTLRSSWYWGMRRKWWSFSRPVDHIA